MMEMMNGSMWMMCCCMQESCASRNHLFDFPVILNS